MTKVRTIELPGALPLTIHESGERGDDGHAVLVLHAGSGPRTIAGFSESLSQHAYVITPTHPGFDGTPRPDGLDTVADLASAYLDLLDALDLTGVTVIGNSVGGWIASEMALRDNHGRISALVLINAVGIHARKQENRVVDVRTINPADLGKLSSPTRRSGLTSPRSPTSSARPRPPTSRRWRSTAASTSSSTRSCAPACTG